MIKNIIFDIGNVLMKFTWRDYVHRIFNNDEELIAKVNGSIWHTGLWDELDRNVLSEEEIFAGMRAHDASCVDAVNYALDHVHECIDKQDYAIPWIKELKARGYKIYFLSNYSHFTQRTAPEVLDFLPLMDGGVFSYEVQYIKPDERIYRALLARYNLNIEECVFIDDNEKNVAGGNAIGLKSILFENQEQAKRELEVVLRR